MAAFSTNDSHGSAVNRVRGDSRHLPKRRRVAKKRKEKEETCDTTAMASASVEGLKR